MQNLILFPFTDYWWFYALFTLFVLGMLALDLGVFHKSAHEVSVKEAAGWSVAWISLAMIFCFGFWHYVQWKLPHYPPLLEALAAKGITDTAAIAVEAGKLANQTALEFLTGFVVEKSLSVDNIFVFIVVFSYFGVPKMYQHRVLFFGIIGALVFRTIFITIGAALIQFHWVLWVFGASSRTRSRSNRRKTRSSKCCGNSCRSRPRWKARGFSFAKAGCSTARRC
jgi:tellurite resistance protein TerC